MSDDAKRMLLRPGRPGDRDALVALWEACGLTRSWNDPDGDLALMDRTPDAEVFVGELDAGDGESRLVASCFVGHDGHRGWLYYLACEPTLRGQGLGARMVRHCEAWLGERGVPKCQVMIRESNLAAKRFYQRIGYQPNSCHLMQRWLRESGGPEAVPGARADGKIECVVTFLEMTARPMMPTVPVPRRTRLALLKAERPTVAFYRFLYDGVGGDWLWWERRAMDEAQLKAIIQDEEVEIFVLYVGGVPAGYAELDRREAGSVDLAYFGLMPDFIGLGLGRYLLTAAIDLAWDREPERVRVNTNTLDHPKALPLYQRMGFVPIRRETRLVDDPRLNGLIPIATGG